MIPVAALIQLGLPPSTTDRVQSVGAPADGGNESARLQAELPEALCRAEVAEAVAHERQVALERTHRAMLLLAAAEPAVTPGQNSWQQQAKTVLHHLRHTVADARRQLLEASHRAARSQRPALGQAQ